MKLLEVLQELIPVTWRDFPKDFSDIGLVIWSYFAPDFIALFGDSQDDLPAIIGMGLSAYQVVSNHSVEDDRDARLSHEQLVNQLRLVHRSILHAQQIEDVEF